MGRQVALAIGVARVGSLPFLPGVVAGVTEFAEWAVVQGFEVASHTDGTAPVRADELFATVRAAVEAGDVERFFVYFGGHGVAPGTGDDLWLLSDADNDPSAAIDAAKSVSLARHCGIPHVAFFADACRTPKSAALLGLVGRPIFPQVRIPNVRVQVDQFFATISGDPAFDSVPGSGVEAFGIFTRCLVPALRGERPEVVRQVLGGRMPAAVLADPLSDYLWEAVRALSSVELALTQSPDCIPGSSWEPNVLSWVTPAVPSRVIVRGGGGAEEEDAAEGRPPPLPDGAEFDEGFEAAYGGNIDGAGGMTMLEPPLELISGADRDRLVVQLADRMAAEPGRTHFETRTGASVVGAPLLRAVLNGHDVDMFEEDGAWHVRGIPMQYATALFLVGLPYGAERWIATMLVPEYVTTVTVGVEGADHVAFVGLGGNVDRDRRVLATAGAAARAGRLGFPDEPESQRLIYEGNPTMALLASYAYDRSGRQEEVQRVLDAFVQAGRPAPYDVVILAGDSGAGHECVPTFPVMRRGWALADTLPAGDELFEALRRQLAPAAWATFIALADEEILALAEHPIARIA